MDREDGIVSHPRRPLAGLTLALAAGTAAGLHYAPDFRILLFGAAACAILAAALFRSAIACAILVTGVFLAGWANAALQSANPSPRHLLALASREREQVELVGVIGDDPAVIANPGKGVESRRFTLRVEGLRHADGWRRAAGNALIIWRAEAGAEPVAYGDRWIVRGVLHREARRAGGLGTASTHYLRVTRDGAQRLARGGGSALTRWCLAARNACARRLEAGVGRDSVSSGFVKALLLGHRGDVDPELHRSFAETGTLHIVAVSGLHVGILTLLCVLIAQMAGIPSSRWILWIGPLLLAYAILTGLRASAVRACIMAAVCLAAPLAGRRPDGPTAVAVAAMFILLACPDQLVDTGFILSFSAVLGLIVLQPRIMRRLRGGPDGTDSWSVGKPSRLRALVARALAFVKTNVATSAAVWLATAPLTAIYFNICSPIALLGNLLVIPLSFVVLLTGVLSAVLGLAHPVLSEVFNFANAFFVRLLVLWVEWLSRAPWGHFRVGPVAGFWFAGWYALILLAITARAYLRRAVPVLAAACFTVAAVYGFARRDAMTATVPAEADGAAVLIAGPMRRSILVNAGPAYRAPEIVRALHRRGVGRLDALVISRADAESAGAAFALMKEFPIRELWCSPWLRQSPVCRAILREAGERRIRIRRLVAGERGSAGDVEWEVLHPRGDKPARRSDDGSLVMRFARDGASILIMNGAGGAVEESLLRGAADPGAEVLVAGDQGTRGTCTEPWLEHVGPRVAVIGVAPDNRRGDPARDVLDRLASRGVSVLRTDEDGSVEIAFRRRPDPASGAWCAVRANR